MEITNSFEKYFIDSVGKFITFAKQCHKEDRWFLANCLRQQIVNEDLALVSEIILYLADYIESMEASE